MKSKTITILTVVVALSMATTRIYDVELSENDNGFTAKGGWVGQTWVAVADSVQWCAFFVGQSSDPGQGNNFYYLDIWDSTGNVIQYGRAQIKVHSDSTYRFLRGNFNPAVKVLKGVKYMLKVSLSNPNDSLNYYLNDHNPLPLR